MSTNTNENETQDICEMSEYAALMARQKRDTAKLPRIDAFRVDCGSGTGTAKTTQRMEVSFKISSQDFAGTRYRSIKVFATVSIGSQTAAKAPSS